MGTPQPSPRQAPVARLVAPGRYHLSGDGITIVYQPPGVGGPAELNYKDNQRVLHFRGDEIRRVEVPDLGTVVSVTLVRSADSGSTSFSVVVPSVELPNQVGAAVPVTTEAIVTLHTAFPAPALRRGQSQVYTAIGLRGTASLAVQFGGAASGGKVPRDVENRWRLL